MRIVALSDLHTDYHENMQLVQSLSDADYLSDALIIAGDISHDTDLFARTIQSLRPKFAHIFFVPGNHDLWLRSNAHKNSMEKFHCLQRLCEALGVLTRPARLNGAGDASGVWIVPLHSWYEKPEESPHSLYVPKKGEDPSLRMWFDERAVKWPALQGGESPARHFLSLNDTHMIVGCGAPVISFSHFLPRKELMFMTAEEISGLPVPLKDPQPKFNFSRVAGCSQLDRQIRKLGSAVHVYGHQHRNRERRIEGVRYVSHCLGYPRERTQGRVRGPAHVPRVIWDTATG